MEITLTDAERAVILDALAEWADILEDEQKTEDMKVCDDLYHRIYLRERPELQL